jgi:hypothetical protein
MHITTFGVKGGTVLYKYRGLTNLQFAMDIFVNKRMFAAGFKSLNDPMEGLYMYEHGSLKQWQIEAIYNQKNEYRILSLSETHDNMLMWSYYAESHTGMVIGVDVVEPDAQIEPIEYVENLDIDMNSDDIAKRILCKKYVFWRHEREHRVFVRDKTFIKVKVRELIFGVGTKPDVKEIVTSVARKFCPGIQISSIEKNQLDRGFAHA